MWQIRPFDEPDIDQAVALLNAANPDPITADLFRENAARHINRGPYFRSVATGPQGVLLGYCSASRYVSDPKPENYRAYVVVSSLARRQGIGSALFQALRLEIYAAGGRRVYGSIGEPEADALSWAAAMGFTVHGRSFESELVLTAWDPDPFGPELARAQARGFRFASLAQWGAADANLRQLYALWMQLAADEPGNAGGTVEPFDSWVKWLVGGSRSPESVWVALDGERIVASAVLHPEGPNSYWNNGTVVDREYRGRGLALAVKVVSLRWAKESGAQFARTGNDEANAAMLAVNRRLGYQPKEVTIHLVREL